MDPIVWPSTLLVPASVKLTMLSTSRGGGQTIDGNEQVVSSPAAHRWGATFSGVSIRTAEQIRAWRVIEARADGRANAVLLPIYDGARAPIAAASLQGADGAPFLQDASAIVLAADAQVNASTLSLSWTGAPPLPGQHFSIGANLYRIVGMASTGSTSANIKMRPWLRAAASAGTSLNFDAPVCSMRLARDDGMALDLTLWRFASPNVDFVEYF